MIHEGMLLEHSGPGLACMVLASHTKQLVVMAVIGALFLPARSGAGPGAALASRSPSPPSSARWRCWRCFLGLVESSYAKLRFFRVPQFLGIGFLCAFLALALRVL